MRIKKASLKNQIIFYSTFVSTFVLIFGLFLIITIYQYTKADMEKHMSAVMSTTKDEISDIIDLPIQLFEHVDFFIGSKYSPQSQEVSDYLRTIKDSYAYFNDVHLVTYDGTVVNTASEDKSIIGTSVLYEPYFQKNIKKGTMLWSKVYIHENMPSISVTIAKENYELIVDINLETLKSRIDREGIFNELIRLDILDQYGTYIVSDDQLKVERRYRYPDFEAMKRLIGSSKQYFDKETLEGYIYVEKLNGYVVFVFDNKNLYSSIGTITTLFFLLWIIFCTVIIRAIYLYLRTLTYDLNVLKFKTDRLKSGDYSIELDSSKLQYEEFVELSDKFVIMADTVEQRENEILSLNETLEKKIEERTFELQELNALLEEEIEEKARYELELQHINKDLDREVSKRTKELEYLNIELKRTSEEAIAANIAKSKFLSIMSHEMRTPLNGIIGFIQMLDFEDLNDEQIEIFDLIRNSSSILVTLINDLLDLSKYESKKMIFEKRAFNLTTVFESSIASFIPLGELKKIDVLSEFDLDKELFVYGDPTKITQLLYNLLNNAIKFTHQGCVKLRAKYGIQNGLLKVWVEVEDTGIGIKDEYRENLFKAFGQGDASISQSFGGSGLGLLISREIAEYYNGSIEYKSIYMSGTTFYVTMEFVLAHELQQDEVQKNALLMLREEKVRNVLIAEDNEINQKVMAKFLAKNNISFDIASNGREAIELVKNFQYDLICMDCQMPEVDGYEATKVLRDEVKIDTPIIAMTAYTSPDDRKRCFEAGMTEFLTKPIDFNAFSLLLGIPIKEQKRERTGEQVMNEELQQSKTYDYEKHARQLMEKIDFDFETCLDLIMTFASQSSIFFKDMDAFILAGDYIAVGKKLHQFKGAAGALRFDGLVKRIFKAEELLKQEQITSALQVIEDMKRNSIFEE